MATTTVDIEFRAKLDAYKREVQSLPGLTKKAEREILATWVTAQREADKAARAAANTAQGVDAVAKEASKLAKIGSVVGGPFGGALTLIADSSEIASDGLSSAGKAALALGAAFAVVATAGAVVNHVVSQASEGVREWDELRKTVGYTAREFVIYDEVVRKAQKAQEGAARSAALVKARMAGDLAPALTGVSLLWTKFSRNFSTGLSYVTGKLGALIMMIPGLKGIADAEAALQEKQAALAEAAEAAAKAEEIKIEKGKEAAAEAKAAAAEAAAQRKADAEEAVRLADAALQAELQAWEARKTAMREAADLHKSLTTQKGDAENQFYAKVSEDIQSYIAKAQEAGLAELDIQAAVHAIRIAKDEEWRAIQAERDQADADRRQALRDQEVAAEEAAQSAKLAAYDRARNDVFAIAQNLNSAMVGLLDAEFDHRTRTLDKESFAYKKAAKKQFAIQKAWALSQAAINTALGITNAIAQNAGMPVMMAIAVALAAAAGASQIALIASQKPSFHVGGYVKPDEVSATLQTGESVLNRSATQRMGGEEGINAINRGAGMPGSMAPSVMVLALDGRIMDQLWDGSPSGSGRSGLAARVDQRVRGGLSGQSGRWG